MTPVPPRGYVVRRAAEGDTWKLPQQVARSAIPGLTSQQQGQRGPLQAPVAVTTSRLETTPMRRSIPLVAVALGAALTLTACGGTANPEDTAGTGETTTAAAGGTLTIWVDETRQPAVEAAAAAFEAETGSTVELVLKNFEDIRADFNAQVPTGGPSPAGAWALKSA